MKSYCTIYGISEEITVISNDMHIELEVQNQTMFLTPSQAMELSLNLQRELAANLNYRINNIHERLGELEDERI